MLLRFIENEKNTIEYLLKEKESTNFTQLILKGDFLKVVS